MSPRPPLLLLVDIGNSRIKWGRWKAGRIVATGAATREGWEVAAQARATLLSLAPVSRVVVASVASARFNAGFARTTRRVLGVSPEFIVTEARAAGVVNGYREPWRLGTDRWAGVIAAHHLFERRRDVCIVDIGTAMTVDLVDADGRHRGGAIIPGPDLMLSSLLTGTSGIQRRATGVPSRARQTAFARNTRDALESGARRAVAAAADRFAAEAFDLLGRPPTLVLTGGAASAIGPLLRTRHRRIPDLVLRGLAVLAVQDA